MSIRQKRIMSLGGYLQAVTQVKTRWEQSEGAIAMTAWFRGHEDASWSLIPSIYRPEFARLPEYECRRDFRRRAYPYLLGTAREPTDDWDWYFLMQHHGLPTRLLDWSESPLVGLFFALREKPGEKDAVVWMLDPFWLNNEVAAFGDLVLSHHDSRIAGYLPGESAAAKATVPVAVDPPYTSRRITAQQGCFTIHGSDRRPLDSYHILRQRMFRFLVPNDRARHVRRELRDAGFTESVMFPDLSSLCRELVDYWLEL
jgi:hypothetical protein